jgi:hypothetical protein
MRRSPGRFASGLLAWSRGEDDVETQAAAVRLATVLLLVEAALTREQ